MKQFVFCILSLSSLLICSCLHTKTSLPRLVDIPTPASSGEVDVFYPESSLPGKSYLEIMRIDVKKPGDFSPKFLTNFAVEIAKKEGLDGLIIEGISDTIQALENNQPEKLSLLKSLGIKYLDQMDYFKMYPREAFVFARKSNQWVRASSFGISPNGKPSLSWSRSREDSMVMLSDVFPYREYHLLTEEENWTSQVGNWGQIKARTLFRMGVWERKRISVSYDQKDRIKAIHITDIETRRLIQIDYKYGKGGRLESRLISEQKELPQIVERYAYDASGRITHKVLKKGLKGKEIEFLRIDYEFYSLEDLFQWAEVKP